MSFGSASCDFVPCPLCDMYDVVSVADEGQFGLPTLVSVCCGCGLVFLSPRWSAERYHRFYREEYDTYYRPGAGGTGSEERAREMLERVVGTFSAHPQTVLDVGSGGGAFLGLVREWWPAAHLAAIEAAQPAVERLESEEEIELLSTDLEADWHRGRERAFDLVVLRHVLEHALEPIELLRKVRFVLSGRRGRAYLAVPDMMHPQGSLTGYWFRVVHTFYFSRVTLARTLARAGLRPVEGIHEVEGELWTIVEPGNFEPPRKSVFSEQMAVIDRHRLRDRFLDPVARVIRRLAVRVPRSVRRLLPGAVRYWVGGMLGRQVGWNDRVGEPPGHRGG